MSFPDSGVPPQPSHRVPASSYSTTTANKPSGHGNHRPAGLWNPSAAGRPLSSLPPHSGHHHHSSTSFSTTGATNPRDIKHHRAPGSTSSPDVTPRPPRGKGRGSSKPLSSGAPGPSRGPNQRHPPKTSPSGDNVPSSSSGPAMASVHSKCKHEHKKKNSNERRGSRGHGEGRKNKQAWKRKDAAPPSGEAPA
ncbi:hypothetical protein AURDEDRAFT_163236 [Auricularia subglabra TFB-10046 SS5]|nr:hypothetical protein AURDEDRAFT_163236 [Auricularia subglabra TFB-10046 SS5]